jgi:hypothetical protein
MSATDMFKAITDDIAHSGQTILKETGVLSEQTDSLLGSINNTCQELPTEVYQMLEAIFPMWKALLERSASERERIGELLQITAQTIEENERHILAIESTTEAEF